MTATELEAGPELDALVAKAVGTWRTKVVMSGSQAGAWPIECPITPPEYSTDLNAAFAAAELAGLFDGCINGLSKNNLADGSDSWEVLFLEDRKELPAFAKAPTGPLAICRAILKMKGKGDG